MRTGRRLPFLGEISLVALVVSLAGCSSSGQNSVSTSSLAPRPEEGMRRDAPQASSSPYDRPYGQQGYAEQRTPAYQPYAQAPQSYARPYYAPQAAAYGTPPPAQPYVQRPAPYAQVSPYPQQPSGMTTASVGGQTPPGQYPQYPAPMGQQVPPPALPPAAPAPLTTGALPRPPATEPLTNQDVYVVHEGDTLFGISKRTGIPVAELVSANKIQNNKISIGQKLSIPQKHAAKN